MSYSALFLVNGAWGSWMYVGECSKSCGMGWKKQVRLCDSPSPSSGENDCIGTKSKEIECSNAKCRESK